MRNKSCPPLFHVRTQGMPGTDLPAELIQLPNYHLSVRSWTPSERPRAPLPPSGRFSRQGVGGAAERPGRPVAGRKPGSWCGTGSSWLPAPARPRPPAPRQACPCLLLHHFVEASFCICLMYIAVETCRLFKSHNLKNPSI